MTPDVTAVPSVPPSLPVPLDRPWPPSYVNGSVPAPPVLSLDGMPGFDKIVIEDDTPVDGIITEKQQRLLTEPLYNSWPGPGAGRPFLALANVGLFYGLNSPPVVPDAMLSLDVRKATNRRKKQDNSYFVSILGKLPEVVLEIVSNRKGGEDDRKLKLYAKIGIAYYIIFDPEGWLGDKLLRVFRLRGKTYVPIVGDWLPEVGLGIKLWKGKYEGEERIWLRWCDRAGKLIPTGAELVKRDRRRAEASGKKAKTANRRAKTAEERAEQERRRAEQERQRAEKQQQRAEQERQRAEKFAAQLRALGINPNP